MTDLPLDDFLSNAVTDQPFVAIHQADQFGSSLFQRRTNLCNRERDLVAPFAVMLVIRPQQRRHGESRGGTRFGQLLDRAAAGCPIRALELMQSGRLHRYNTAAGEVSDVALLEKEYAEYVGAQYCLGLSSCGSSIYVALKSVDVLPGAKILCNAFTLAPVPGAIENAGAVPVFVEITDDYLTDLEDLENKAKQSGAKYFLLSHMRGHIVDMDRVMEICRDLGITLIEDCAHTVGCRWGAMFTGRFGKVGCYSSQTYKHINSGEGGLLVTDDDDVMLISDQGQLIRMQAKGISLIGRATQGVRLLRVDKEETLVALAKIVPEDDDTDLPAGNA